VSARKLATYVHVADKDGAMHVFGPNDKVPGWAERQITNPKAWADGKSPATEDPATEMERLRARLAELEATGGGTKAPPKAGPGSGKEAWAAYAAEHQVDVPEGATREQILQLLTDAQVPTE
jgi:hypothetical protein